ncbi:MAG: sensor histidine kinase, partial [Kofleriaceae bacterium]
YVATARLLSAQNVLPPVFLATLGTQREDIAHHIAGYLSHQQRRFETDLSAAHTSSDRVEWLVIGTTGLALMLSGVLAATVIRKLGRMYQREKSALEVAQHEATGRQEILAVVSHDLRNPLGTIVMGSSVLRELLPPGTPPACVRQLQAISNAADRMTNMINQVLDEARIEIGTIRLHLGRCELNELVRTAMQLFQTRAEQCSIQVVFEPPVAQLEIRADRERVLQILSNLLGNALKYTPQGGRIEVRVAPSDDEIEISVTDSGPGISRDQLPHIFERYYQGPSKERGSLGLGLYICKNLVEAHGGRIWADPAVEQGARITFTLPRGGPVARIAGPRGGSHAAVAEPPRD